MPSHLTFSPKLQAYGQPVAGQAPAPAYAQPQPAYAQPQAYQYPPQPSYYNPDEVRTIFVTGFPQDVKERELKALLRFIPGYEVKVFFLPWYLAVSEHSHSGFACKTFLSQRSR